MCEIKPNDVGILCYASLAIFFYNQGYFTHEVEPFSGFKQRKDFDESL